MKNKNSIKISFLFNRLFEWLTPFLIILIFMGIHHLLFLKSTYAHNFQDQIADHMKEKLEVAGIPPEFNIQDEIIHASVILTVFYARRNYLPAWSDYKGPTSQADDLIQSIKNATREGLNLENYFPIKAQSMVKRVRHFMNMRKPFDPEQLVNLDLLLTHIFLIYSSHLLGGRVNPDIIDPEYYTINKEYDLAQMLQNALDANKVKETLQNLIPTHPGYIKLRDSLAHYREIAENGGWPIIPNHSYVQKSDWKKNTKISHRRSIKIHQKLTSKISDRRSIITRGGFIKTLQRHLIITGDLSPEHENSQNKYDESLEQAIRKFQNRHGLDVDGIIGPVTLEAMNTSVEERIQQIELNMERYRWNAQDFGQRYILVNIADCGLSVIENEKPLLNMRAIVGKPHRKTPMFSSQMTYLVFNPYWNVPPTIAQKDILPIIQNNPEFLSKRNIKILQRLGKNAEVMELNPETIDWAQINTIESNLTFRQDPGPENPLGRVKFMFPNKYAVYIHDTPSRDLFEKSKRMFSSGCIRIEKPIELAEFVLEEGKKWTKDEIVSIIEQGKEQSVILPEKIPVHLRYWTAWVDDEGVLHFRNDIYERDNLLFKALRQTPPDGKNIKRWCNRIFIRQPEQQCFLDWVSHIIQDKTVFLLNDGKNPLQG